MRENPSSQEAQSLQQFGISVLLLAAVLAVGALSSPPPRAAALDLSSSRAAALSGWQCYAAWHPSWRYLAVQGEDCAVTPL